MPAFSDRHEGLENYLLTKNQAALNSVSAPPVGRSVRRRNCLCSLPPARSSMKLLDSGKPDMQ
jgi:hypothetical protein